MHMTPIHKTLIEIEQTDALEKLEAFKDASVWAKMRDEERNLLAMLLVKHGARQLAQGNSKVLESFDIASKVSSNSVDIYLQQAKVFLEHDENPRCISFAGQAFLKAVKLDPENFEALFGLANVQLQIGVMNLDSTILQEADGYFLKASFIAPSGEKGEVYWGRARCFFAEGKNSGEPSDFISSVGCFREAAEWGLDNPRFWTEYGNALAELGTLLDKLELYEEALLHFSRAVEQSPDDFTANYLLACCLYQLGQFEGNEVYFDQAWHYYERAAFIEPDEAQVWAKWGQLELSMGKRKRDVNLLEASLEKFERTNQLEPDNPSLLSCWAETELFLGTYYEKVEYIQSAKEKINQALELKPDSDELWYLFGTCLNDLGHYFASESYFHSAIEKFEYGLSLTHRNPLLWYGIALSYFALGELHDDPYNFEKAVHCFARVAEAGGSFPQLHNDWGTALMRLGEINQQIDSIEAALAQFEIALRPKSSNMEVNRNDIDLEWIYNYGCAHNLMGELKGGDSAHFEKAVEVLSQVIASDPHYSQARYNYALALFNLGEEASIVDAFQGAIDQFQILLKDDPEDDEIHMDSALSWIHLGQLKEDPCSSDEESRYYRQAEYHLLQARALGRNESLYYLATVYSLLGQFDAAIQFLEKAYFEVVLPPQEVLMEEEWLEPLRETKAFKNFIRNHF